MFYVNGWAITLTADTRGRPYWQARRGGWHRGAPSVSSLRTLMRETPAGAPMGTRQPPARIIQLPLWRDAA